MKVIICILILSIISNLTAQPTYHLLEQSNHSKILMDVDPDKGIKFFSIGAEIDLFASKRGNTIKRRVKVEPDQKISVLNHNSERIQILLQGGKSWIQTDSIIFSRKPLTEEYFPLSQLAIRKNGNDSIAYQYVYKDYGDHLLVSEHPYLSSKFHYSTGNKNNFILPRSRLCLTKKSASENPISSEIYFDNGYTFVNLSNQVINSEKEKIFKYSILHQTELSTISGKLRKLSSSNSWEEFNEQILSFGLNGEQLNLRELFKSIIPLDITFSHSGDISLNQLKGSSFRQIINQLKAWFEYFSHFSNQSSGYRISGTDRLLLIPFKELKLIVELNEASSKEALSIFYVDPSETYDNSGVVRDRLINIVEKEVLEKIKISSENEESIFFVAKGGDGTSYGSTYAFMESEFARIRNTDNLPITTRRTMTLDKILIRNKTEDILKRKNTPIHELRFYFFLSTRSLTIIKENDDILLKELVEELHLKFRSINSQISIFIPESSDLPTPDLGNATITYEISKY